MTDIVTLLQEFYRDKLVMMLRHAAAARVVPQYDANNTYQYIINREETQLGWIAKAIEEALVRMEKGTFGICRDCGEPISLARLEAIPWTRVCISCKQKQSA